MKKSNRKTAKKSGSKNKSKGKWAGKMSGAFTGFNDPATVKGSLLKSMGTMLTLGAVTAAGCFAGAAIGRKSVLAGLVTSGIGLYTGIPLLTAFSAGMMASNVGNSAKESKAVSGMEGLEGLDGVKERMKEYADNLKYKLYLDKLLAKNKSTEKAPSMGEVQYFNYPQLQQYYQQLDQVESNIGNMAGQRQPGVDDWAYEPDVII